MRYDVKEWSVELTYLTKAGPTARAMHDPVCAIPNIDPSVCLFGAAFLTSITLSLPER